MYIASTTNQHIGQKVSREIVALYVELAETSGGFFHNVPEQHLTFDPFHFVNAFPAEEDPADLDFDLLRQGSAVAILCRLYDHWCDVENFDDSSPWIVQVKAALDDGAFVLVPHTETALTDIFSRNPGFHDLVTARHFDTLYGIYVRSYFEKLVNTSLRKAQVTPPPLVVYVDVDETLVRNVGRSRVPIPGAIAHVRELADQGAELYCWSSGGAEYARDSAREVSLEEVFTAFLPKPQVLVDDQRVESWRRLVQVHPLSCPGESVASYRSALDSTRRSER